MPTDHAALIDPLVLQQPMLNVLKALNDLGVVRVLVIAKTIKLAADKTPHD